jgi:hypothetical protein
MSEKLILGVAWIIACSQIEYLLEVYGVIHQMQFNLFNYILIRLYYPNLNYLVLHYVVPISRTMIDGSFASRWMDDLISDSTTDL